MKKESSLSQLFKGFDYKKYWEDWNKEHPNQSKEFDWGEPVGREYKW
jgi:antitoxin MazE|nr:MAG TPA: immunoglobulin heavy chain variable region addiction, camel antibody, addiction.65A [Caudoviricetes sp.]